MMRDYNRPILVVLLYLLVSASGNAWPSSGLAEYDQPWEICALCHSLDGNSRMAKFPKLAGQPSEYIQKQLHDFLADRRQNDGGQMSSIVTEIDTADIEKIADWFASQKAPEPVGDADTTGAGERLFRSLGCADCHSPKAASLKPYPIPYLTAQHAQYLVKQLNDFQQGNRVHMPSNTAVDTITNLTQNQINELVTYLAATARE